MKIHDLYVNNHQRHYYKPDDVLMSYKGKDIKVREMLISLKSVIQMVKTYDLHIEKYKISLKFFEFSKNILENKNPSYIKFNKEKKKLIVDVLEEICSNTCKTDEERENCKNIALFTKTLIDTTCD
jgi:hypothetical protein